MDMKSSSGSSASTTTRLPVTSVYAASSLNAEITAFVLFTGILVGLLLVVVVLCICKCCLKPNKPLKRQQVVFTKYPSEREESTWNGQKDSGGNSTGSTGGGRYASTTDQGTSSPTKSLLRGDGIAGAGADAASGIGVGAADDDDVELGTDTDQCEVDDQNADLVVTRQSQESGSPLLEVMTFTASRDNRVFQECSRESSSRNHHRHHHHLHHHHHHHPPPHQPDNHDTRHTRSFSPSQGTGSRRVGHLPLLPSYSTVDEGRIHGRRFPRSPPIQRQSPICSQTSDECPIEIPPSPPPSPHVISEEQLPPPTGSAEFLRATLASPEESSSLEDDINGSSAAVGGIATADKNAATYTRVAAEVHVVPSESPQSHRHPPHRLSPKDVSPSTLFPRCALRATSLSSRSLDDEKRKSEVTLKSSSADADCQDSFTSVHLLRPASTSDIHDTGELVPEIRHVPSTEDGVLTHMMETRRMLFTARRRKAARGSPSSDDDDDGRSKVRYNDTGSREEVNEEVLDMLLMATDEVSVLVTPLPETTTLMTMSIAMTAASAAVDIEAGDDSSEDLASSQSRLLWELRATFEEDEELSDTLRMDEMDPINGNDQSDDDDANDQSRPAEVGGNLPHCGEDGGGGSHAKESKHCDGCPQAQSASITQNATVPMEEDEVARPELLLQPQHQQPQQQPPNLLSLPAAYESRRQSYKNILSSRVKKKLESSSLEQSTSIENSQDSVETTTEGSSTDASRLEAVTTSMESTTDNTDSTGDGQIHHRLQQMKHDSGYKSLEAGNGSKTMKKQIHFAVDDDGGGIGVSIGGAVGPGSTSEFQQHQYPGAEEDVVANLMSLELPAKESGSRHLVRSGIERGGSGKTASKKRREYTRERQMVETSFGIDLSSSSTITTMPTAQDSSLDDGQQGKSSVFVRFFQSSDTRPNRRARPFFNRDFSIDEKSDTLFREFSRRDPSTAKTTTIPSGGGSTTTTTELGPRCRSPRLHSRHHRFYHHRHPNHHHHPRNGDTSANSSGIGIPTGVGSGVVIGLGVGHIRSSKLSPQDSIEEEKRGVDAEDTSGFVVVGSGGGGGDIPIIKVAAEDSS